jgi:hypothetical protein
VNGCDIRLGIHPGEEHKAAMLVDIYQTYVRCRNLKLNIDAKDIDPYTLDILYTFHQSIEDADEKRRQARAKHGR